MKKFLNLKNYEQRPLFVRLLLIFLSGALCSFALPPYGLWPLFFIGFGFFYFALSKVKSSKAAFFTGWLFGLGYFLLGLNWIGNALLVEGNEFWWVWPLAVIALPIALSVFTGLASLIADRFFNLSKIRGFIALCFALSLFEYLRGHLFTGFPWNLYGYIWSDFLPIAQIASIIGPYGLTLITLIIAGTPAYCLAQKECRYRLRFAGVVFSLFVLLFAFGWLRLSANPTEFRQDVQIQVVQPYIEQKDKWDNKKLAQHFEKHIDLSQAQEGSLNKKTYIIWPETALGPNMVNALAVKQRIKHMLSQHPNGSALLTGTLTVKFDQENRVEYYNNISAYSQNGALTHLYYKSHLVPFGEYVPFQNFIPIAPVTNFNGFQRGDGPTTSSIDRTNFFSPFICYEVIFPGKVVPKTGQRPDWLLNVTNDGWYGYSPGPFQHYAQGRMRSIEEGIPLVRSANTGISGIIDPYGRDVASLPLLEQGLIVSALPESTKPTLYSFWRNIPFLLSFVIFGLCIFLIQHRIKS